MSVLIECLTIVIPIRELDIRYPGQSEAFYQATLDLPRPPRYVCPGDERIVGISFYSPEHAQPVIDLLVNHGFTDVEDGRVLDFAYVDQHHGPTMPCDWLGWKRHRAGFSYAWLAGTEPGDMAVPLDWTPERSRQQERHDVRDDAGRMLKLAEEDGIETWLDLETGEQMIGLAHPRAAPSQDSAAARLERPRDAPSLDEIIEELKLSLGEQDTPATRGPLLTALIDGVRDMDWKFRVHRELPQVRTGVRSRSGRYAVFLVADERAQQWSCRAVADYRAPAESRSAMCEALARANYGLLIGAFEMDLDDGEIQFRIGWHSMGEVPDPADVEFAINSCIAAFDRYTPAFLEVIHDRQDPAGAIAEVGG